jgi:TRAP-type uncharacterized transport system fused permease subunit
VPFVFAFHPELLIITDAIIDPRSSNGGFINGYDGAFAYGSFALLLLRLIIALYLLSSALAAYDKTRLAKWEIVLRLALAALLMMKPDAVWIGAFALSLGVLFLHSQRRNTPVAS